MTQDTFQSGCSAIAGFEIRLGVHMRLKVGRRLGMVVGAAMGCLLLGALPALATQSTNAYYGPILGYKNGNYSNAYPTYYYGAASAFNADSPQRSEPSGYLGAQASFYHSGALCHQTAMLYSFASTSLWHANTSQGTCGSGEYHAKGSTAAYNGSGYSTYYTNQSPSFNG